MAKKRYNRRAVDSFEVPREILPERKSNVALKPDPKISKKSPVEVKAESRKTTEPSVNQEKIEVNKNNDGCKTKDKGIADDKTDDGSEKHQGIANNHENGMDKTDRGSKKQQGITNSNENEKDKMYHANKNLGGLIFMCNSKTKPDCFHYMVMGLPDGKIELVMSINPDMKLFLYDYDLKLLYGIYKASSSGGMRLEPAAFNGSFGAQVRFSVDGDFAPLPINIFSSAIMENFDSRRYMFKPELSFQQVKRLTELFYAHTQAHIHNRLTTPKPMAQLGNCPPAVWPDRQAQIQPAPKPIAQWGFCPPIVWPNTQAHIHNSQPTPIPMAQLGFYAPTMLTAPQPTPVPMGHLGFCPPAGLPNRQAHSQNSNPPPIPIAPSGLVASADGPSLLRQVVRSQPSHEEAGKYSLTHASQESARKHPSTNSMSVTEKYQASSLLKELPAPHSVPQPPIPAMNPLQGRQDPLAPSIFPPYQGRQDPLAPSVNPYPGRQGPPASAKSSSQGRQDPSASVSNFEHGRRDPYYTYPNDSSAIDPHATRLLISDCSVGRVQPEHGSHVDRDERLSSTAHTANALSDYKRQKSGSADISSLPVSSRYSFAGPTVLYR